MGLTKRVYTDEETIITAKNLNDIQDAVIGLEDGLFSIDNTKSGEVITITDAYKRGFRSFSMFGRTTQDGTPTPDAPVDLVSVGDGGSITVNVNGDNDAQSMTIATPNGLPGIPVTEGGNYTDANGQQWVCDEIDCERRKLIVRVLLDVITKTLTFTETEDRQGRFVAHDCVSAFCKTGYDKALSNFAEFESWGYGYNGECFAINSRSLYYYPENEMTADEVTAMFANMVANGTPPVVMGQLRDPIEIDLTDAEFAAYAALHTYKDNTTVSNDAGAYMELEYVMDSKKYIDGLITGGIVPATVE